MKSGDVGVHTANEGSVHTVVGTYCICQGTYDYSNICRETHVHLHDHHVLFVYFPAGSL